jgi:hypothetical protein
LLSKYIQKNGPLETDNPKQGKQGLIDLTIDRSNTMKCDTWLVKDNRPDALDTGEPFHYDAGLLKDMTRDTKTLLDEIEKDQTFSRHYRSIGEKARQILTSDRRTTRAIDRLFLEVGGAENVWVRFQMASSSITETPFEAILRCDREDEDDPYQLELSPVYRVINKASGIGEIRRKPIFSKRFNHHDKLSCLVINASASGEVQPFGDIEFPPLCQMLSGDGETETVRAIFEDLQDSGSVLVVEKIEFDSDEKLENPSKYLEDKLQEREWDIVHFCGHSFFDNELGNDPGYIFLPGDILAKPVSISRFSDWCRKTDLIFMSSCQSAAPGFIHALADKGIPMIVGYRWRVTDAGASFFAEYFYRKLFDEQRLGTIETAFSMTQRRMKDPDVDDLPGNFQDNRIWASSMLVLQNV